MNNRFVITGVSSYNKGAELMLYAILQQIEERYPHSTVFLEKSSIPEGFKYINTSLSLRKIKPYFLRRLQDAINRFNLVHIFRKLHLWDILFLRNIRNIDMVFDASGLRYSDLMCSPLESDCWYDEQKLFMAYKKDNACIILLPQQFGPFEHNETKISIKNLVKSTDIVFAREKVSFYNLNSVCGEGNIHKYPDFTSLVEGIIPKQYHYLKGSICIIPNCQMINKKVMTYDAYVSLLAAFVNKITQMGKSVFLLNHESIGDEKLCYSIQEKINDGIDVITGLNALEVKGLISNSYLCISSRYHGVASSLNSCVPCLATSWTHKYKELFNDFSQKDCILDVKNQNAALSKIEEFLNPVINTKIRDELKKAKETIVIENKKMWDMIWSLKD